MNTSEDNTFDLLVIGTGMAGAAAAVFAANRGLATAQVGETGGIIFASGCLDLLGVYPPAEKNLLSNPWAGLEQLAADEPANPLARMKPEKIRPALDEFLEFLEAAGLPYRRDGENNCTVLTPLGTVKPTYCIPETLWAGGKRTAGKRGLSTGGYPGSQGF